MTKERKNLSAKGMISSIKKTFMESNKDYAIMNSSFPISDCLLSGLALFGLKFPSLLQFEEQANKAGLIKKNLKSLYQIKNVPSDTYLRERLDEVNPDVIKKNFKKLFALAQRGNVLKEYSHLDGYYLMPMDMTGFFSSPSVKCENCCIKQNIRSKVQVGHSLPKNTKKVSIGTYLLIYSHLHWSCYYVGKDKKLITIALETVPGLQEMLEGCIPEVFFDAKLKSLKELIALYHDEQHQEDVSYYHNMMCAVIAHPDKSQVIPFAPEAVIKSDGSKKNDCERKAGKRLISDIRREHPHLKLIAVQDSIASNYPNLNQLKEANIRFITGAKPGDHKHLFSYVEANPCLEYEHQTDDGKHHRYRYINDAPLNAKHHDFKVNFIEYWETDKKGRTKHFSWVTDIMLTESNVFEIMRGGRTNWKIENNTFNTLKNQDYHFSHNFGHGYKNLSTVFGTLMLLAFMIDQLQELACGLFKAARNSYRSKISFWNDMQNIFKKYVVHSWEDLWSAIAFGHNEPELKPNTS